MRSSVFFVLLVGLLLVFVPPAYPAASSKITDHLAAYSPYPAPAKVEYNDPGCRQIHLTSFIRHGSRNPEVTAPCDAIQKMLESKKEVISSKLKAIRDWKSPFLEENVALLSEIGSNDMHAMGKRYREMFADAFSHSYHPLRYKIESTSLPRTTMTAYAVAAGLFRQSNESDVPSQPVYIQTVDPTYNTTLQFTEICTDSAGDYTKEERKWAEKKYPEIGRRLVNRLMGLPEDSESGTEWTLTPQDVTTLYEGCAFEVALSGKSALCDLFSVTDAKILEYGSDLRNYYKRSYGNMQQTNRSATALELVVNNIDAAIRASKSGERMSQAAHLLFVHESLIIPLSALLGLNKDSYQLSSKTPQNDIDSRKFSMSKVSPFGSNLAFSLYECSQDDSKSPEYRVRLNVNEKEVNFPGCSVSPCPLETFRKLYKTQLESNFNSICPRNRQFLPQVETLRDPSMINSGGYALLLFTAISVGGLGFIIGKRLSKKSLNSPAFYSVQNLNDMV